MSAGRTIGRALVSAVFVIGGGRVVRDPAEAAASAEWLLQPLGLGVTAVRANAAVQVLAGFAVAVNVGRRPAAALLAVTLVPTTVAGHRFWDPTLTAPARVHEGLAFLTNVGLLGGVLLAGGPEGNIVAARPRSRLR